MADHGAASSDGAHQPEVMELIGSSDEAEVITSSDDLELVQDEVVQGEVEPNEAMALVQHEAEDDEVTMVDRWLDGTVRDDYMEIFCPPRVAPLLRSKGYRAGLSLDITSDLQLDFSTSGERGICLREMECRRPRVLLTCSPCTMFSRLMTMWNIKRMSEAAFEEAMKYAEVLFESGTLCSQTLQSVWQCRVNLTS